MPLRRTSSVAVHDDGDVHRQAIELDLASKRLVRMAGRNPRQEMLTRHGLLHTSLVLVLSATSFPLKSA
jgi:hypothetical protein